MIIAALLGALTFGACVDSTESASVTAIRNAKAEQLKSVATLNNAKAQAEATLAAAEAQLAAAQAQLIAAEAAALNATTEAEKIKNQIAAANAQAVIARIQAQLELDLIKYQADLLRAQAKFTEDSDAHIAYLYSEYSGALADLATWQKNLADAKIALAEAEANHESTDAYYANLYNYYVSLYNQAVAQIDSNDAKIEALSEISSFGDMTSKEEVEDYIEELNDAAYKASADVIIAADAEKAAFDKADDNGKYGITAKKHAYSTAYVTFTSNNILGAGSDKSNKVKVDGYDVYTTYKTFKTYKWDITKSEMAEDKVVELFYASATDNFDYYGTKEQKYGTIQNPVKKDDGKLVTTDGYNGGKTKKVNGQNVEIPTYVGRVNYYDIVADNVEVYEEAVENYISLKYDAALASAELAVELAEEIIEEAKLDEKAADLMSDYETVVEAIAETEVDLAEAQQKLAELKAYVDLEASTKKNETGLSDDTWKYYNKQIADLEAEIKKYNDFLEVAVGKEFVKALDYEYSSLDDEDGLYDWAEALEGWFKDGKVEDGILITKDAKDAFEAWTRAIKAEENLKAAYDNDVEKAEKAVAALETMVDEYESWVAYAIDAYNAAYAAWATANVNTKVAEKVAKNYSDKAAGLSKLVDVAFNEMTYDEDTNATGDLAAKCAGLIATLEAENAALKAYIMGTAENNYEDGLLYVIDAYDPAYAAVSNDKALADAQNAVAEAEVKVAIYEAKVASAKAALDAALAM